MIKYENVNIGTDTFSIYTATDLTWNTHFHQAIECATVTDGEINCTIDGRLYKLTTGDSVLIMSNQMHSFETKKHSKIQLVRFSPKLVGSFFHVFNNKIPLDNYFKIHYPAPHHSNGLPQPENIYALKGLVYFILGKFCSQQKDWKNVVHKQGIVHEIILYIEENFKNNCTLKEISAFHNYDYTYLSRIFLKVTGITFVEYLNNCRIIHACYLIENTDMPITQIAHECGYSTIRTFNRNLLKYTNTTTKKYMK